MTNEIKVNMIDRERDVMELSVAIDQLETDNILAEIANDKARLDSEDAIKVVVNGETYFVDNKHYDVKVGELIVDSYDVKSKRTIIKYLRSKYQNKFGVPADRVSRELMISDKQAKNLMLIHYGKEVKYIDYSLIADFLVSNND